MWIYVAGTERERKVIGRLWADLELVAEPYLPEITVEIRIGDEHFNHTETDWVGSCEQKSDKSFVICLRRSPDGALYLTALHEVGHALGLDHMREGVMVAARRQRAIRLTVNRRRRWLRDFVNQLLIRAVADRIR